MNAIRILKTNNPLNLYGVISWLFVLCGGKLYLDWVLITNPISRNPIIKLLYGWAAEGYSAKNYNHRYYLAYVCGAIHLIAMIINISFGNIWGIDNILINIYPIVVQIYIGYRCWRVNKYSKQK